MILLWDIGIKYPNTVYGAEQKYGAPHSSKNKHEGKLVAIMSIYDQQNKPAYRITLTTEQLEYCKNPYVLRWWTPEHDVLISNLINEWQWHWYWHFVGEALKITPPKIIAKWKKADPICRRYSYYNVLMYFALSRAQFLGLNERIRKPNKKICPLCNQQFVEDSLPGPLVDRLGIDGLDFCAPCLKNIVFQGTGNSTLSRQQVLEYIRSLTDALQRIPHQDFGKGKKDLLYLDQKERLSIVKLLRAKPTIDRVKELFGSWLKALIEAGVLEDGTRRTGLVLCHN